MNGEAQMALLCNEAHEFNCKKTLIKFKIDSANRISTDAIAARVRVFPVLWRHRTFIEDFRYSKLPPTSSMLRWKQDLLLSDICYC